LGHSKFFLLLSFVFIILTKLLLYI
jgi:hypothetical protein